MNPITFQDSYKFLHPDMYPKDLTGAYAYFESRGGEYPTTIFYGLQATLTSSFEGEVFDEHDIEHAQEFAIHHLGIKPEQFPVDKWYKLYDKYGGALPLLIKAVPEGMEVPVSNVLFTVESTDEEFAWLVGYFEDQFVQLWYPTTVATSSFYLKRELKRLREQYSDNLDGLEFMVHDFGLRGVTCAQQGAIGGSAHLLSFRGTDTTPSIYWLNDFYGNVHQDRIDIVLGLKAVPTMTGFSIPATEHSIILSHENESTAFKHVLDTYPSGMVACVSDTNDIYHAVGNLWGGQLREQVLSREGTLVVRPDSGDPTVVVPLVLDSLWFHFGGTINSKGLRVLDPHIRVIQGDGMKPGYTENTIIPLYEEVIRGGFAPENLTVGSGGGLLQDWTRDTNQFAYKFSAVKRGDEWYPVSKHPVTDKKKRSKAGRFALIQGEHGPTTVDKMMVIGYDDLLEPVFRNGEMLVHHSVAQIRKRIDDAL